MLGNSKISLFPDNTVRFTIHDLVDSRRTFRKAAGVSKVLEGIIVKIPFQLDANDLNILKKSLGVQYKSIDRKWLSDGKRLNYPDFATKD